MLNEKKEFKDEEVDETTNQSAPLDEKNDSTDDDSELENNQLKKQEESEDEIESDIDYEAELAEVQEKLQKSEVEKENYKQGLLIAKSKLKGKQQDSDNEDTEPETINEEQIARKVYERIKLEENDEFINQTLNSISSDDKEQKLIKFYYDNRVSKSGFGKDSILNDLQDAKILANKKKIMRENEELRLALSSKTTVGKSIGSSVRKKREEKLDARFTKADLEFMKKRNIDPKTVKFE